MIMIGYIYRPLFGKTEKKLNISILEVILRRVVV